MKIYTLIFILTLSPCVQAASFVKVAETIEATFYLDKDSAIKSNNKQDVWVLMSYKNPKTNSKNHKTYSSALAHHIYTCSSDNFLSTYMKIYSGNMADGQLLDSFSLNETRGIPQGSTIELVRNFVCK